MGCSTFSPPPARSESNTAPPASAAADNTAPDVTASPAGDTSAPGGVEITIPTTRTGQDADSAFFRAQVDRFNQKYAGQYKITLEESTIDTFMDTIQQMLQRDQLPPLIVDAMDPGWFADTVIAGDKFYDLKPWLDDNPDIMAAMLPDSIKYNTTADGKIASLPLIAIQAIGLFTIIRCISRTNPFGRCRWTSLKPRWGIINWRL